MNICFVLPKVSRSPIGGYKMVFLYAERLSKFNSVEIHYINDCLPQNKYLPNTILNFICSIYLKSSNNWFKLNNKICNSYGTSRHYDYSKPDIVIATSVVTVQYCDAIHKS